jgi:two-component system sensor histidine kinase/response regulator
MRQGAEMDRQEGSRRFSLRHRLLFLTLFTCGICLLIGCAAFLIYDEHEMRHLAGDELQSTADMLGMNSVAALAFRDSEGGERLLQDLEVLDHIRAGVLYDADGKLFASYVRAGQKGKYQLPENPAEGVEWRADGLRVVSPVALEGRRLGVLLLESDLDALKEHRSRFVRSILLVTAGMLLLAYMLTVVLQRSVTKPIQILAGVAQAVAKHKIYGLRAPPLKVRELHQLAAHFNHMLDELAGRDAALVEARNTLEERVAARTRELEAEVAERTRAEAALRQSEELFRTLSEAAPIGIYRSDANGSASYINRRLLEMMGLQLEEALGKGWQTAIHPEDREAVLRAREAVTQTLDDFHPTYRFLTPEKVERWVEVIAKPILTEGGSLDSYIGVIQDVTERRKADERLSEQTTYLNTLLEGCPIAIVAEDQEGRIQKSNRAFRELFGYSQKEMDGRSIDELLSREDERADARSITQSVLSGQIIQGVGQRRHKSGVKIDVEAYGVPLVIDGVVRGQIALYQDINERLQAQRALRESEERFRTLSAVAPVGIALLDNSGRISYVNEHYLKMTGLTGDEALQDGWRSVIHPEDLPRVERIRGESVKSGENYAMSYRYLRRDGRAVWVDTVSCIITGKDGSRKGYVVVIQDVTERQLVAERLREAKETAEAANRAKSDFLANMSHEIRTPMNGIIGMTELALDTDLSDEQREYLEMVRSSAEALLGIINDILDLSKIEAGKLDVECATFSLFDCVEGALQPLAVRAQQKGLELNWSVESRVPEWVQGDSARLRQILINLVGNAIKFTKDGEVSVRVEATGGKEVRQAIRFVVSDTGVGIPKEKYDKIFEAFSQADSSTTREFGGTGLGLSISSRLVKLMGGEIWLRSTVGKGTEFYFTASIPETSPPEGKQEAGDGELEGKRVLVADDHEMNRRLLAVLLPRWGLQVELAEDGHEALQKYEQFAKQGRHFSLVLLDKNMPQMCGLETAERIRRLAGGGSTAILLLTSSPQLEDSHASKRLGIARILTKPIKREELRQAMAGAIRSKRVKKQRHSRQSAPAPGRALNLLLAEDNLVNQRLAIRLLEKMGHSVTLAANGKETLEKVSRESFDLVLMDIQMPVMGGVEATQRIRGMEAESGKRTPIVAMTAHAVKGDREKYLAAGMDGYVPKPIHVETLRKEVTRLTRSADAQSAEDGNATRRGERMEAKVNVQDLLGRVENDRELLRDLVDISRNNLPEYLNVLTQAVHNGHPEDVARTAHTLKGMLGNLAATRAAAAAAHLENLGKASRREEFAAALERLNEEVTGLLPELEAAVAEAKP